MAKSSKEINWCVMHLSLLEILFCFRCFKKTRVNPPDPFRPIRLVSQFDNVARHLINGELVRISLRKGLTSCRFLSGPQDGFHLFRSATDALTDIIEKGCEADKSVEVRAGAFNILMAFNRAMVLNFRFWFWFWFSLKILKWKSCWNAIFNMWIFKSFNLRPTFFLMFINHVPDVIRSLHYSMYTDDTAIHFCLNSISGRQSWLLLSKMAAKLFLTGLRNVLWIVMLLKENCCR